MKKFSYQREWRKGFYRGYEDHSLYVVPRCGSYHSDAYKEGYEDGWAEAKMLERGKVRSL